MTRRFLQTILILAMLLALLAPRFAWAGGVVLNFNDVDISTMVKFISDLTGRNFVMDDRVKGKISVYSPTKLSPEEAFNVFTSVLELKGFTVVQSGRVYKIVPTSAARQSGMTIGTAGDRLPVSDAYLARVVTLEHISAIEAVPFLQPVVSKDGHVSAFGPANMLLVVDSSLNIRKVLSILEVIDVEPERAGAEILYLKNAAAENVAAVVRDWLAGKDRSQRQAVAGAGSAPPAGGRVIADSRLNALILSGSEREKEDIRKLVALVDVSPPTASSKVNVYYMENADAAEVAKVLDNVIKGSAGSSSTVVAGAGAPQQQLFEGGKISITPDKATNSLVIMATPADYQNIIQVIQKLDRKRRQVHVQALIAEVSLDKLKDLGIEWGFIGSASTGTVATLGLYDPYDTFTKLLAAMQALSTSGISNKNLDLSGTANFPAVLKALETNDVVNVLSTPSILTSDNKEAEIFVGENVPFRGNITISNTTTTPSYQSIDRKDTGITLKITPQISEGEFVKLDLYQEISAVKNAFVTGAAADITTTKRSAKTSVAVKDRQTVAIGGLIQDRDLQTVTKVPYLSEVPLLGRIFTSTSTTRQKTNLLIFLTPTIIKDASDLVGIREEQKHQFQEAQRADAPLDIGGSLQKGEPESKPNP